MDINASLHGKLNSRKISSEARNVDTRKMKSIQIFSIVTVFGKAPLLRRSCKHGNPSAIFVNYKPSSEKSNLVYGYVSSDDSAQFQ